MRTGHHALALMAAVALTAPIGANANTNGQTGLADEPVFASSQVPGNLALALSVEYPTATRMAHVSGYDPKDNFPGYFATDKCYEYVYQAARNPSDTANTSYFEPIGLTSTRTCSNAWSGNFLNWATTAAIDPFRWAMTGGRRVVDTTSETIIEKGYHSGQGSYFNDRSLPQQFIAGATPFSKAKTFRIRMNGLGFRMGFFVSDNANASASFTRYTAYEDQTGNGTYDATIRVKVCDRAIGLESNCKQYGSNYKPEGLVQEYAQKMRFSAFGYLNQDGNGRDGGVLRARQKFVGPTYPEPGQPAVTNDQAEWDPSTGIMAVNPDADDARDTTSWSGLSNAPITNSGVMNYLNKFGQIFPGNYKSNDPVNELYYAALRYFRGLDNIPAWSNLGNASASDKRKYLDGFPVIRDWNAQDPIQYGCQRNFILGIGDIYTHHDRNVPGGVADASPTRPNFNDIFEATKSTSNLKRLQGLGNDRGNAGTGSSGSTDYMAGLAFEANTLDIRKDDANIPQSIGKQTVQTYWVDVLEAPFVLNNKFYLAAKFGGLDQSKLPNNFNPYTFNGTIPDDWWTTNGETLTGAGNTEVPRPNNYFTAGSPAAMISGLQQAFQSIANEIRDYTTSFSYTSPAVTSGDLAYASQYDSTGWTGAVTARRINYDATTGQPSITEAWNTDTTMTAQLANNGWNTDRRVVTWNGSRAVPFLMDRLSTEQKARLNPSYTDANDTQAYINYIRGDKVNELTSTSNASTRSYRSRSSPIGDIVNSKITAVSKPIALLRDAQNPGYLAYKAAKNDRQPMIYVGANDGMLHAFYGAGSNAGQEAFAYIPSAMFDLTLADSSPNGLAGPDSILGNLGNPNYLHRYAVDATPMVFDADFRRTFNRGDGDADWRSILVGGLGKGGRSFFAIDVSTPSAMTTESAVASNVLWEFTDEDMGFSFGSPIVVKTAKYGWVVLLTSGYNNADGVGYLYVINPRTGELLEKVATPAQAPGMAHASAFIPDFGDGTTDAVYAGDLNGTVWRFDLTGSDSSKDYLPAAAIAQLRDRSGANLPITTAPLIEVHPDTRNRYVMLGTGKLLSSADISSQQQQTFFAIKDGTAGAFKVHTSPVRRANLRQVTDLTTALSLDMNDAGWYLDLGRDAGSGVGWRIVAMPAAASDVVVFTSMLTSGDACSPAGSSRIYAVNFAGAKTALANGDEYAEFDSSITDLRLLEVDGEIRLIAGDNQGNIESIDINIGQGDALRMLNWRETFSFD